MVTDLNGALDFSLHLGMLKLWQVIWKRGKGCLPLPLLSPVWKPPTSQKWPSNTKRPLTESIEDGLYLSSTLRALQHNYPHIPQCKPWQYSRTRVTTVYNNCSNTTEFILWLQFGQLYGELTGPIEPTNSTTKVYRVKRVWVWLMEEKVDDIIPQKL